MNLFKPLACPHCGASLNNFAGATVCPRCNKGVLTSEESRTAAEKMPGYPGYFIRKPGSDDLLGPYTAIEITNQLRSHAITEDCGAHEASGQSYTLLRQSDVWFSIKSKPGRLDNPAKISATEIAGPAGASVPEVIESVASTSSSRLFRSIRITLGVITGTVGSVWLVYLTLRTAIAWGNKPAASMVPTCLALLVPGLAMLTLGLRMTQRRDRKYFLSRRATAVLGLALSGCLVVCFLFKTQDGAGVEERGQFLGIPRWGTCAYDYYFVWPRSQREAARKVEDAKFALALVLGGYSSKEIEDIAIKHNYSGLHSHADGREDEPPFFLEYPVSLNLFVATLAAGGVLAFTLFLVLRGSKPRVVYR